VTTPDAAFVQIMSAIICVLAIMIGWESVLGHYRSGFPLKPQYLPALTSMALALAGVITLVAPRNHWGAWFLMIAGWAAIATGVIGAAYHHYYGIVEKPGAYKWWLHHLMYHAPALAPLASSAFGALAVMTAAHAREVLSVWGIAPIHGVIAIVSAALAGGVLQSAILHYRGAFNNPAMYVPFTAPLAASIACALIFVWPGGEARMAASVLLWLTVLSGFVGLGMHLRGIDREMGGLYVASQNLMQGPPLFAPVTLSGFAGAAIAAIHSLP
jgi:hypothetical protein